MTESKIPYFVTLRGCASCDISLKCIAKHGDFHAYDPILMSACQVRGCDAEGYNIGAPFIDPVDILDVAKKEGEGYQGARKMCVIIKQRFGEFYKAMGVNLDDIIAEIDSMILDGS